MNKITKSTLVFCLWTLVGIIYFPIFLLAWLLKIAARILLAIAYFGMLNKQMGKMVFKSIFFNPYERTF